MLSGFYSIASGMLAQHRNIDLIANNLVNMDTPGFRAERMVFNTFRHELMIRQEAGRRTFIGATSPITLVDDVLTLHHSGLYEQTGHPFDLAINGRGLFVLEGDEGQTYLTRGGQFHMDEGGYLVRLGIGRVMGQNGPVRVQNARFSVQPDGTVLNQDGRRIDALLIADTPELGDLERLRNGMYQMPEGEDWVAAVGFQLQQGVLERSNVNFNTEIANFIEAQRHFQAASSALTMIDAMNRRAVTQIASRT